MFSGDQSFSRDQQLDLMGDDWGHIRYPFWGVDSNQVKSGFIPDSSGVFQSAFPVFLVYTGFFSFLGESG